MKLTTRRLVAGLVAVAGVSVLSACGGSQDALSTEPIGTWVLAPEMFADDGDGVFRFAANPPPGCSFSFSGSGARVWCVGVNLAGRDLRGADLFGANMSGANLTGADLSGAWLMFANFTNANLSQANLTGARLSNARFSNTTMPDGSIRNG